MWEVQKAKKRIECVRDRLNDERDPRCNLNRPFILLVRSHNTTGTNDMPTDNDKQQLLILGLLLELDKPMFLR